MKLVYYIDTNIFVSYLRGKDKRLRDKLNSFTYAEIKIPSIVKGELLAGAIKSNKPYLNIIEVEKLCRPFEIVPFDNSMLMTYGKIRAALELKGQKIGANDTIIATTVLYRKGILVTNNVKEFSRVEGLMIEDWTSSNSSKGELYSLRKNRVLVTGGAVSLCKIPTSIILRWVSKYFKIQIQ